jgi:beta-lactam-binding protein with PASTA domain
MTKHPNCSCQLRYSVQHYIQTTNIKENGQVQKQTNMKIHVHVKEKNVTIQCGAGQQVCAAQDAAQDTGLAIDIV